ncbi:MAG: FAD/NAD(P)-binding protein [Pseudomonadota bacterium]
MQVPARIILAGHPASYGRGLAYGTFSGHHLLNVPAGRMGVDPAREAGFADYLRDQGLNYSAADFVPRSVYGAYLEACLDAAAGRASPGVTLERCRVNVQGLVSHGGSGLRGQRRLLLQDGSALDADQVVLATGNFASRPPFGGRHLPWDGTPFLGSPWATLDAETLSAPGDVLLVGSGLTAMDMALQLARLGHQGRIVMVSRRGQLAKVHRHHDTAPRSDWVEADFGAGETCLRNLLRELRRRIARAAQQGGDWRDVVGSLRAQTVRLWQQLPARGKAQFVRHLAPYWDVHRHRAAPEVGGRLEKLMQTGQVTLWAGTLTGLALRQDGSADVSIRRRGQTGSVTTAFKAVINCIGPCTDVTQLDDSLFRQLLAAGEIVPDPMRLGLQGASGYELLDAAGQRNVGLYYIGPFLKADYWEATAVPELRVHAQALARQIAEQALIRVKV